jgi:DNA-binding transcriptional MocR family regulator
MEKEVYLKRLKESYTAGYIQLADSLKLNLYEVHFAQIEAGFQLWLSLNEEGRLQGFENFKYHALCARATLYPGKSIEEISVLLDSLKDTFGK